MKQLERLQGLAPMAAVAVGTMYATGSVVDFLKKHVPQVGNYPEAAPVAVIAGAFAVDYFAGKEVPRDVVDGALLGGLIELGGVLLQRVKTHHAGAGVTQQKQAPPSSTKSVAPVVGAAPGGPLSGMIL